MLRRSELLPVLSPKYGIAGTRQTSGLQRHSSVATNLTRESKMNERLWTATVRNFAPKFRGIISEHVPKYLSMVVLDPWHMDTRSNEDVPVRRRGEMNLILDFLVYVCSYYRDTRRSQERFGVSKDFGPTPFVVVIKDIWWDPNPWQALCLTINAYHVRRIAKPTFVKTVQMDNILGGKVEIE